MDVATAHRDDLVAEVDLALAALRRVIVKAIDRPQPAALVDPSPDLSEHTFKPYVAAANGVEIDLDANTVAFGGQTVTVSMRQAQLAAVLAKASPDFIKNDDVTRRAWPDLQESSRATSISQAVRSLARHIEPLGLRAERIYGRGCRLFAIKSGAA